MSVAPATPPSVVLCTLNARYIHASLGLRYLLANMGSAARRDGVARVHHFARSGADRAGAAGVARSAARRPAPGHRLWRLHLERDADLSPWCACCVRNARSSRSCWAARRSATSGSSRRSWRLADHVITGWGDVSFPKLCQALLHGPQPLMKIMAGEQPALDTLVLPYQEYSDADLAHRVLYVEASRGCPFKCAFCLSSLDKTAWAFDADRLLAELDTLFIARCAQLQVRRPHLQSEDRRVGAHPAVFSRSPASGRRAGCLFVHFEVIPDHLPERLKADDCPVSRRCAAVRGRRSELQSGGTAGDFPAPGQRTHRGQPALAGGAFAGPPARRPDLRSARRRSGQLCARVSIACMRWVRMKSSSVCSSVCAARRSDSLSASHGMVYESQPPYTVRQTAVVSAQQVDAFVRLARYWDLVANSGRFRRSLGLLLGTAGHGPVAQHASVDLAPWTQGHSPFAAFWNFSAWLWAQGGQTSGITPEELVDQLVRLSARRARPGRGCVPCGFAGGLPAQWRTRTAAEFACRLADRGVDARHSQTRARRAPAAAPRTGGRHRLRQHGRVRAMT